MTTLAENEEHLVEPLRTLPSGIADHVITWVTRLRDLGNGRNLDWSDAWTDEDLADARAVSFSTFDERERLNS